MSTPTTGSPSAIPVRLIVTVAALVVAVAVVLGVVLLSDRDSAGAGPSAGKESATDAQFPGLVVAGELSRNHTSRGQRVDYPDAADHPPLGGNHAAVWQNCQVYTAPVPTENAVHSLEHGAVWVTYQPGLAPATVSQLAALAAQNPKVLVSPREQSSPIALTAWGRQLSLPAFDGDLAAKFLTAYLGGGVSPEPKGSCQSPIDQPGTAPFVYTGTEVRVSTSTETAPAQGQIS